MFHRWVFCIKEEIMGGRVDLGYNYRSGKGGRKHLSKQTGSYSHLVMEIWNSCQLMWNVNWLELRNNQHYASEPCPDTLNEDWWIISCAFLLYSCPTILGVIIHVRKQQGISSVTMWPCASRLIWELCRLRKSQDWSEVRYRKADLCSTGLPQQ